MAGAIPAQARLFRFGPFELDVRAGELRKHGTRIKLREQPVRILLMLLDHPGEVVLRDEIRLKLWPNNTIVEFDHGINAAIQKLRDALGESADQPRYVETVARRGYRFLGEVERVGEPAPESPPDPDSDLTPAPRGSVVSHYRLLDKLGEGGMGVVYRAEDLKLGRQVAVKFLPMADGELPDSVRRRFEREARAASALNHPNICTVHGLEDFDGKPAIVMELVEGGTLASRLARGRLLLEEAVRIAMQIADALAEAHRRGVVHRDLKPANIMLTGPKSRPSVKVLDFGLAKMERPVTSSPDAETVTERGAIVGTLHYMSPEQVQGKEADARSDIFSFGLVLYEMVTGQRAFEAESRASVIAAILEREPPEFEPEWLNRVVKACLAKDPEERFQRARDLKRAIEWGDSGDRTTAPAPRTSRKWTPWVAAAAFAALAFLSWLRPAPAPGARQHLEFTIAPPAGKTLYPYADSTAEISPDGSSVLYDLNDGLWLQRLDSVEPKQLRGSQGFTNAAFWSPDSMAVVFPIIPNLLRIRAPDGVPEVIGKLPFGIRGGTVSEGGTILLGYEGLLYTLAGPGTEPKRLDVPGMKAGGYRYPQFLPGSQDFLFLFVPQEVDEPEVCLATLRNGKAADVSLLMKNDTAASYTPAGGGRLFFVRGDNLYSQTLDLKARKLKGDAELVQQGVASLPGFTYNRAGFSVSRTGAVAWRAGRAALNQVTIFDRRGKEIGAAGPADKIVEIFLSPDEKLLLAQSVDGAWLLTPGQSGSLSLGKGVLFRWLPDGLHLAGKSSGRLVERAISGSNELHDLGGLAGGGLEDISPDGRQILHFWKAGLATSPLEPAQNRAPAMLVHTDENLVGASFSPDGRWVAYLAVSRGTVAMYAQPTAGPGIRTQISSMNRAPVWRKDGKEILIADGRGVWSVSVETADGGLRFGAPQLLFSAPRPPSGVNAETRHLAVSRDGSRIFLVQGVEQPESNVIHVKTGW